MWGKKILCTFSSSPWIIQAQAGVFFARCGFCIYEQSSLFFLLKSWTAITLNPDCYKHTVIIISESVWRVKKTRWGWTAAFYLCPQKLGAKSWGAGAWGRSFCSKKVTGRAGCKACPSWFDFAESGFEEAMTSLEMRALYII